MGVDLGGGDVGVAQQGLDDAQVGAALQQMGGEGVAKDVGADLRRVDAGADRGLFQQLGKAPGRQAAGLAARREQPGIGRVASGQEILAHRQPGLNRRAGGVVERRQPLLAALALDDQVGRVPRQGGQGQAHHLRHPHARGVGQLDQGRQPQALAAVLRRRGGDQPLDLLSREDLGQRAALLRRLDPAGRVVGPPAFPQHEPVELPDGRAPSGGRRGGEAGGAQTGEPGFDVLVRSGGKIPAPRPEEGRGVRQVLAVGGQGVAGGRALDGHHLEEGVDPALAHSTCSAANASPAKATADSVRPARRSAETRRA